jgi:hypothetical protein
MMKGSIRCVLPFALLLAAAAEAQAPDPLPPTTQLVAASAAPAATEETFTIAAAASGATQPDLLVTFTDFQTPAPLNSATVVVTQGAAIVGQVTLTTPATTATLKLPAAVGQYTLRVVGTPNTSSGVGTFSVCVAPSATPSACIQDASLVGNITQQTQSSSSTVSSIAVSLTVKTGGSYVFTYVDQQFPAALAVAPELALFQGSQAVSVPVAASPATINLSPGTYELVAIAQASSATGAGLYGISITGPAGVAPLLASSYPVGGLAAAVTANNPTSQSVTLSVVDFAFPTPLTNAQALVSAGGATIGTASSTGGAATFTAPAGALQVWKYGAPGTGAGTYEVDLAAGSTSLAQSDVGVNGGGAYAFAATSPKVQQAGSYQATANDFQFPAELTQVEFAVAENGAILKQASAVGSVSFTTGAAGTLVLLAAATPSSGGTGTLDLNIQTGGSSPQLVFDQLEPVNAAGGFISQTITLGTSGTYDVTLTDLKFPAQFATLALIGASDGAVLGKVYGGGTFTIAATPASYQFNVLAIPAAQQQYGLYGIQVVNAPPTVTLTASPTTVSTGATSTLSWTTTNATSCTASGGTFTGSQATGSGSLAVVVSATTTYQLSCTGAGGTASATATVTATQGSSGSGGGGGALGPLFLGALTLLLARDAQLRRTRARV